VPSSSSIVSSRAQHLYADISRAAAISRCHVASRRAMMIKLNGEYPMHRPTIPLTPLRMSVSKARRFGEVGPAYTSRGVLELHTVGTLTTNTPPGARTRTTSSAAPVRRSKRGDRPVSSEALVSRAAYRQWRSPKKWRSCAAGPPRNLTQLIGDERPVVQRAPQSDLGHRPLRLDYVARKTSPHISSGQYPRINHLRGSCRWESGRH